jgi:GR25 family glycosyltransferase involved in LPS biosynthesis
MEVHCKFQNTIIALLSSDKRFINICETFEALGRFKENIIDLSFFDQTVSKQENNKFGVFDTKGSKLHSNNLLMTST